MIEGIHFCMKISDVQTSEITNNTTRWTFSVCISQNMLNDIDI